MANLTPEQAAAVAQQAADAATAAAEAAQQAARAAHQYAAQAGVPGDGGLADATSLALHAATGGAIDPFVFRLSIFVLAIFVGYYVVWQVTPALHTPLMSVTNAISSVIVVGALLAVGVDAVGNTAGHGLAQGFGFVGLILASVNIFGAFLVTSRMLAMYKKKTK
ncbi:NAD(P) transhydrogenase subunit alpha [Kaistia soli DSM 19436]|uniref:proton-translocating NAD(P)(+) transhydrogenase n=1 Tax=Kaistia soli DSM 19436 TaxID=1122133 RepID=A0A1M5M3U4_9HYPH|nr:proton-translocating transhydrogenase family protein [Kaistia soli]SHG71984.1 NAD(P) transhydrogenase subunit alpha [Kaistia soli DSM 19436]